MIILPTLGRPHNLVRFMQAYEDTKASLPIHVILDADDAHNYKDVKLHSNFTRCTVPAGTRLGGIFKTIWHNFKNEAYYGIVADDVVPTTKYWDVILAEACQPNKIAWGDDTIQGEALPTHPFIGGDLVRKLGWWAAPGFRHFYIDNVWKLIADKLGVAVYLPEVKLEHRHMVNRKAPVDKTYAQQPDSSVDRMAFEYFQQTFKVS